jgi:PHD/YefM family antitoxin component YafN of YafNO toxin-antitoxin module
MKILTKAIVSNSQMMKNYKSCRDLAGKERKVFIFKNNIPDAVLMSITEYERLSGLIEYSEYLEEQDIAKILQIVPLEGDIHNYDMGVIRRDVDQIVAVDIVKKSNRAMPQPVGMIENEEPK